MTAKLTSWVEGDSGASLSATSTIRLISSAFAAPAVRAVLGLISSSSALQREHADRGIHGGQVHRQTGNLRIRYL